MYVILWKYQVKVDYVAEFEKTYGESGAWMELFLHDHGYLGTELLRSPANHYLTIDRWESKKAYELFLSDWKRDYEALDAHCEGLIEQETLVGKWETVSPESR